jgi:hypothetical protein
MNTKKFWCHYIGSDGNTPKRRSIELTDIRDIMPNVTNDGVATPLWVEIELQDYGRKTYWLYAQLSDKVAVYTLENISSMTVEKLVQTDEEIDREYEERMASIYSPESVAFSHMTEEKVAAGKEAHRRSYDDRKKWRDKYLGLIRELQNYDEHLLTGEHWIANATIRAYEEAGSPYLPVFQEIRRRKLEEREARERERQEENRRRREEEARKKAEQRAAEDAKLQKLVELGLLPEKLTALQRGTVLAGLEERGRFKVAGDKMVACTVYELIADHGFNRISKSTETHNRWGEPLAKPRNSYCVFNDTLNYGYQINGHMGVIMVKAK